MLGATAFSRRRPSGHSDRHPEQLARNLEGLAVGRPLALTMISNRGTQVWPPAGAGPDLADHSRCRVLAPDSMRPLEHPDLLELLPAVGLDHRWVQVEKLQVFDGVQGVTAAQGQRRRQCCRRSGTVMPRGCHDRDGAAGTRRQCHDRYNECPCAADERRWRHDSIPH